MQQILGLRVVWNPKKEKWDKTDNTFAKRGWGFKDFHDLIKNLPTIVGTIPEKERFNMFYTVASCGDSKRAFSSQSIIIFDVDGLGDRAAMEPKDLVDLYAPIVCKALGIEEAQTAVVFSGNGLHFIIGLETEINDPAYFDKSRKHYNAFCMKIDSGLKTAGLSGNADPSVWDARRIMRLPDTLNQKEGKPERMARLVRSSLVNVPFDLARGSGLPEVSPGEQINPTALKQSYPTPDTKAILEGCEFLKWCKEKPNEVRENQWYAMLSILPKLPPSGRDLAHEYSSGHSKYSRAETEAKIEQALEASGPRTCANIQGLSGRCGNCKYSGKVASPIMIQGEEYLKSKDNGFYTMTKDANGVPKKGKPDQEGLRMYFNQQHPYIIIGNSGVCLTFNGKHWESYADLKLKNYAYRHFDPKVDDNYRAEFQKRVCCTQLKDESWLIESTNRKINFANGVLDLDSMELVPHSKEFGFRYVLDYDYDPNAKCPEFEKFMLSIMDNRQGLVDVLMEFAGYSFSNDECWAEKAMILTGDGSNGKTTFMNVLKALAGKKNYCSLTMDGIHNDQQRVMLDGRLFNLSEETPTSAMTESSILKNLISGGEIPVKILYKQPYEIANKAKLWFACNTLPRTRDTTEGWFRKLLICPFDKKFEGASKDPFIKKKLFAELPGIFNLVIAGYARLKLNSDFTQHDAIDAELKQYKNDLDSVRSWYEDSVIDLEEKGETSDIWVPVSQLYSSYDMFAENRGEKPEILPVMVRRLRYLMKNCKQRQERRRHNGNREQHFRGLKYSSNGGELNV